MRQVSGAGVGDPLQEPGLVTRDLGSSSAAKERIRLARAFISGQAAESRAAVSRCPSVRFSGLVSRSWDALQGARCGRSLSARPWLM